MSCYGDRYDVQYRRAALIICDLQRPGAWNDVMKMDDFFKSSGFDCTTEGRPTPQRLLNTLEKFRKGLSDGYVSYFIMVIMAHGVQGRIALPVYREDYYDNDEYIRLCHNPPMMDLAEIFYMFDNRQCPAMREKPKLFIVQACRGEKCHAMGFPSLLCDSSNCAKFQAPALLPTLSDYMIVYAAQPGKTAFRHPEHGCPLFAELVKLFKNRSLHMSEIFTMLTEILRARHKKDWASVGVPHPPDNTLHTVDGLSKKWYLFDI